MRDQKDEFFKRRKGQRKTREVEVKALAPYRYLIVCEGEETETNYFEGIQRKINRSFSDKIDIKKAIWLDIKGTGRNTNDLVKHVQDFLYQVDKLINRTILPYGHIWVIFDKDDFSDGQFNSAIEQALSKGYRVGWSNESIELWFLLHFEYLNSGIGREAYCEKLTKHFKDTGVFKSHRIANHTYNKNIDDIFEILYEFGSLNKAITNSRKLISFFENQGIRSPAKMKPANTVFCLIEDLKNYLI